MMEERFPEIALPPSLDKESLKNKVKNLKDSSRNSSHKWFAEVLPAMEKSSIAANPAKTKTDLRKLGTALAAGENVVSNELRTQKYYEERGREGVLLCKSVAAEAFLSGADVAAATSAAAAAATAWLAQQAPGFTVSSASTSGKAATNLHQEEVTGLRATCILS